MATAKILWSLVVCDLNVAPYRIHFKAGMPRKAWLNLFKEIASGSRRSQKDLAATMHAQCSMINNQQLSLYCPCRICLDIQYYGGKIEGE